MSTVFLVLSSALVALVVLIVSTLFTGDKEVTTPAVLKAVKPNQKQIWLSQARVNLTVKQYWLCTGGSAIFTFAFVSAFTKTPLVAIVFAASAAWIPHFVISKKRMSFSRELVNCWPEALRDISATI
ncbi:MAG TPA: hypothetical protein PLT55_03670, partial [Acidimicrobiia bacterium]|nr:hypothetical protein [Acidimicrobiia bacterium]